MFGSILVALLITAATLYLRKFIAAKAENLAQKQDLKDLTTIVEGVKSRFERANVIHNLKLQKEFTACVNTWKEACLAHKQFCRFHLVAQKDSKELAERALSKQVLLFKEAQVKFTDTLKENQPFILEDVWKAFEDFESELIAWKDSSKQLPTPLEAQAREKARHALDECNRRIRNRFAGEVYLSEVSSVDSPER